MKEQLKEFGLTDNEVRIYLILLEHGPMNPYEIADKTGFHRGYIYDAMERMQEKGVISSILKDGKKHFQAAPPEGLLDLFRMKMEGLEKIIPDLKKLSFSGKEETRVEVYKSERCFRIILKDILATLKEGEEVLVYGVDDSKLIELEPIYLRQYFTACKKKGISERIIVADKSKTLKEAIVTEYRFLPEKYMGSSAFEVYGNRVGIFLLTEPKYLILIESKEVADSYRKQFELLWKLAKK